MLGTNFNNLYCDIIDRIFFCKELKHKLLLGKCHNGIEEERTQESEFPFLRYFFKLFA